MFNESCQIRYSCALLPTLQPERTWAVTLLLYLRCNSLVSPVFQLVVGKVMIHAELAGCRVGHNSCLCKRI